MAKQFDINLALHGKDEGASSTVDSVARNVKVRMAEMRASGDLSLERLIKQGPEGIAKIFGAGLAVAGIELGARALEKVGTTMQEVRRQFVEGKEDAGEMWDKVAEGIPIFGDVWKAGRAIHEGLTGEKLAIELVNEEAKLTTKYFDDSVKAAEGLRKVLESIKDEIDKIAAAEAEDAETDPLAKKVLHLKAVEDAQEKADKGKTEADKKKVREDFDKKIADAQAIAENQRKQFKNNWYGLDPDEDPQNSLHMLGTNPHDGGAGQEMAADLEQIKGGRSLVANQKNQQLNALQKIDDEAEALRRKRIEKLNLDIGKAQTDEGNKLHKTTEKQMEEQHKLTNDAADETLKDRKRWAKEAADQAKEDGKEDKDVAEKSGHAAGKAMAERLTPFQAVLLNSRYQGVAKRDPVADNTGRAVTILEGIRELLKNGPRSIGDSAGSGFTLRA